MIRKLSFVLLALSMTLAQQVCFAANAKWDEERSAGQSAYNENKYDEASRIFEAALKRMEADSANAQTDLAACCGWLGNVYKARGQYAKAEPLYKRALAIREKALGPDHPDTAAAMNELASLYSDQGRYDEAETMYQKSLAINERTLGPDAPNTALSINNLAVLYSCQGRYLEASRLYNKALVINEKNFGSGHPNTALPMTNLAVSYSNLGRYAEAEPLFKEAISIRGKAFGFNHPDTARSMASMAELYKNQGRYTEAESLAKSALTTDEKIYGLINPIVASDVNNLAVIYYREGRYPEAETLYKRALNVREQLLGLNHPDVALSVNNLALLYKLEGRYSDAEPLYKRALDIRQKALGNDSPATAVSLGNLAGLYFSQGRYTEAEPLFKLALGVDEKVYGSSHQDFATDLFGLAALYKSQGRYVEAEPLYKRACEIYEKVLGPEHSSSASCINHLARFYSDQGRYQEAEPLYEKALALNEKRLGVRREIDPFIKAAGQMRFNMVVPLQNLAKREIRRQVATKSENSLDLSRENREISPHGFESEIECLKLLEVDPRAEVMTRLGNILATRKKTFGENDPRTAEVLIQLGILGETLGGNSKKQANAAYELLVKFGKALAGSTVSGALHSQRDVEISNVLESMGGDENARSFAANALICLGNLLAGNNEVEKAKDAFTISEKCFLAQSSAAEPDLVKNLLSLSESWMNLGEYARAQELLAKASALATSKIAKYQCSAFDARLKLEQADYSSAFESAKASLESGGEAVSTLNSDAQKSQALLDSYKVIIESALSMGKLKEAKEFADQALSLKGLSKQGQAYLLVLRGTIDFQQGSFKDAKKILQSAEALNDGDKELDQATFTQAATIKGFVLERLGDLTEAQRSLGWALSWDKKNPSSEGLLAVARDCNGLALIEMDRVVLNDKDGDSDRAKYYALEGSQRVDKYIKTAFPGLSIGQQCAFLAVAKEQRDAILTTCQKKESIGPAYSMMMRWKGLLLESLRTRGAIKVAVQDNHDLKQKQEQLEGKIRLLASLANKGGDTAGGDTKEQYRKETAERERLEREISAASGVVLKDPLADIGVDAFRGLLKTDEAFIDILPYKPLNEQAEHYGIVTMKSGPNGEPQFFDLGKRSEIDDSVRSWRFAVTGSQSELQRDVHVFNDGTATKIASKQFDDLTAKLSDLLLTNAKLQEYRGSDVKRLWLCPEGEFGRVPWTAIALLRGINNLSISEVDSPREFAFLRMNKSVVASNKQKQSSKILLAGLSDFQKAGLKNLDGALKEVESLKKLADKLDRDVDYLPEYDATKDSVKSKLTMVANAHIATHGFAGKDSTEGEDDRGTRAVRFTMRQDGIVRLATARNPLSECGIYLAYPKVHGDTAGGDQAPNILTADEIIGLDLSNCDILTLSACETGLGRTLSGQGVIGLRSAIIGAGAKSVLMSLWSVPDDATQELMKRFYSNLWKEGMSKRDALADAQAYIRKQSQWKEPKNWAAWVLVGE